MSSGLVTNSHSSSSASCKKTKTTFIVSTSRHDRNRDGKEIIIISFLKCYCSARDIEIPCCNNDNYNEDTDFNKNDDDNCEDESNNDGN